MRTRTGRVRVGVAGWGMAAVLLVTACSGDDGDSADAESAGARDVEVSTEAEAAQDTDAVEASADDAAEAAGEAAGVADQTEPTRTECATEVEFPDGYPVDLVPLVTCDATVRDDVVNDTFVYVVRLEGDGVIAEQTALLEDTGWTLEAVMPWSDDSSGTKPYLQGAAPLDGWDVDITARPEGNEHAPDADVMDIFVFESD